MSPKRVCLVKRKFSSSGGLEKYTFRIASALINEGAKVDIVTADPIPKAHFFEGLQLHQIPSESLFSFQAINRFDALSRAFIQSQHYDTVLGLDRNRSQTHIRAGNGVHAAFLDLRKLSDPFYKRLSYRFNPLHRTILDIEKTAFESPDLEVLFTNSHMVKKEILHYYNVSEKKIAVVHNGVEWREFAGPFESWLESKAHIATKLRIDPHAYHFLFVGHGYERKGLKQLLEGFALISNTDTYLSVVGKDKNIPYFAALAQSLGIAKRVSFFSSQAQLTPFYQLADCLVIPSLYDPFANVTVEALAMGLNVISSKYNGGSEVLSDQNGIIIDDLYSPDSVATALQQAILQPKTWLRSLSIRQQAYAFDFSIKLRSITDRLLHA